MVIYCQDCGHPNIYGSQKPNFCQSCGAPVGKTKAKLLKARKNAQQGLDDDDSETTDATQVPDIDHLEVEIEGFLRKKAIKMGDVAGTANPKEENPDDELVPPQEGQAISEKDFLEQFQKEAGAIRPNG